MYFFFVRKKKLRVLQSDILNCVSLCHCLQANFADLYLPRNVQLPKSVTVEKLPTWDHGVSSGPVTIVDSQTFLVPNVMYDGLGPGESGGNSMETKLIRQTKRLMNDC